MEVLYRVSDWMDSDVGSGVRLASHGYINTMITRRFFVLGIFLLL